MLINERLLADFVVEVCNPLVRPVFPQSGQDVTQRVWPGDKHTVGIWTSVSLSFIIKNTIFKKH